MPDDPRSLAMRPQYGSWPYHEHLQRLLSATLRAPIAAWSSDAAPTTSIRTDFVAPSASSTIASANTRHASAVAASSASWPTGPASPLANSSTVSLVDMQPSTDITLNEL